MSVCLLAVMVVAGLCGCGSGAEATKAAGQSSASSTPQSFSSATDLPDGVQTLFENVANAYGDGSPLTVSYVATTMSTARAATHGGGDQADDTSPAYLFEAKGGTFTAGEAPPGQKPPTGTVLVVLLEPSAKVEVQEFGVLPDGAPVPDLSALGEVHQLK